MAYIEDAEGIRSSIRLDGALLPIKEFGSRAACALCNRLLRKEEIGWDDEVDIGIVEATQVLAEQ